VQTERKGNEMKKVVHTGKDLEYLNKKEARNELFKKLKFYIDEKLSNGEAKEHISSAEFKYGAIATYIFDYYMNPQIHTKEFNEIVEKVKVISSEMELMRPKLNRAEYEENNREFLQTLVFLDWTEHTLKSDDTSLNLNTVELMTAIDALKANPHLIKTLTKEERERAINMLERLQKTSYNKVFYQRPAFSLENDIRENDLYKDILIGNEKNPTVLKAIQSVEKNSKSTKPERLTQFQIEKLIREMTR